MDKLSIAVIAYNVPKYLYVCLDGISRLRGRNGVTTRVYIDGGISADIKKLQEEVISEFDFAEAYFAKSNLGILKNTTRGFYHSCKFAKQVLHIEDDHLVRPDSLEKIRETKKDGFFLCLSGIAETKQSVYRAKGNVVNSCDFQDLYNWIENMEYVGKKCPYTGRIIDEDNTSHDVVFNIYLHEHNLKTHFVKGIHVTHFGIMGTHFLLHNNTLKRNKETCELLNKMFSGDKTQWLSNVVKVLHEGNYSHDLYDRLWPAGFTYEGVPAITNEKPLS